MRSRMKKQPLMSHLTRSLNLMSFEGQFVCVRVHMALQDIVGKVTRQM